MKDDTWVWVLVGDPEGNAGFVGLQDSDGSEAVIPAYQDKEAAEAGFKGIDRDMKVAAEVQAIRYDDLCRQAEENGFSVAVIGEDGKIIEKKEP